MIWLMVVGCVGLTYYSIKNEWPYWVAMVGGFLIGVATRIVESI